MRRFLARTSTCAAGLAAAAIMLVSVSDVALSDGSDPDPSFNAAPPVPTCGSNTPSPDSEPGCGDTPRTPAEVAEARAYLVETASPGYTMTLQGPELAIGRLHPEFAIRLEHAIREARSVGLPFVGVFSAYRPPAFGVGGFFRQIQFAAHVWACRRHARHRRTRLSRSAVVALDRGQERRRMSLWPARSGGMESLPADERKNHLGAESLARNRDIGRPGRPREHVRGRQSHDRGHGKCSRVGVARRAHAHPRIGSRRQGCGTNRASCVTAPNEP